MKKLWLLLVLAIALFGCGGEEQKAEVDKPESEAVEVAEATKVLEIEWQRMVDEEGRVCCGSEATSKSLQTAYKELNKMLEPKGIEVVIKKSNFSPEQCMDAPERSNRVLVAGHGIEHWLNAQVGESPCEGFCKQALGDKGSCRNLIYEGKTYDVVPAELIVEAAVAAAARPGSFTTATAGRCGGCPSKATCGASKSTCGATKSSCGAVKTACDPSCKGDCGYCAGKAMKSACTCKGACDGSCGHKAACTCKGACDGSCGHKAACTCEGECTCKGKVEATTSKASGCPKAKTCSKTCAAGT
jgi:hypothetical protein